VEATRLSLYKEDVDEFLTELLLAREREGALALISKACPRPVSFSAFGVFANEAYVLARDRLEFATGFVIIMTRRWTYKTQLVLKQN
jgi:uncharacterized membrane protein